MGVVDFLGNNKPKFVNTAKTGEGGMPVPKRVCIVGSGRWCALFCYIWIRFGVVFTARCYASVVLAMGLCLCLSQVGVLLERLNVGSHKQYHTIAQEL